MHSLFKGVFALIALVAMANCSPVQNPQCQKTTLDEAQKAERALADFAVNLYKNISAQQDQEEGDEKNEIVSPVSVALALALLEAGADGNTRRQLQQQLTENGASDEVLGVYRALEQQLRIQDEHTRLQIANGVFHDKQVQLKREYQQAAQDCLDAQVQQEDFQNQLEQTRQHINKFIAEKTENKIPELFKKNSLQKNNRIVLANAIYLRAAWQQAFNKKQTKQQPFYRQGRQQDPQNVPFMQTEGQFRHSQDEQLQVVELKYEKAQLSMYVLLPKQRDGLKQLEKQLSGDRLRSIIRQLQNKQVQIQLPKFSVRSPHDLKPTLSRMGLSNLFSGQADLSRLSEEQVHIGQAVHESYIKIDEQGTEAAAATGIGGLTAVVPSRDQSTQFVADHPFLYTIVHNPTGAVVFIGKVTEVQSEQ